MAKTATITKLKAPASKPIRRKLNMRVPVGDRNYNWVEVFHEKDPKQVIWDAVGEIPKDLVQFSKVLVAVYTPPMVTQTAGGIILTDTQAKRDIEEYHWQGKVGLIVATGQQAYVDDDNVKFHGTANKVGDWVWFLPSEGQAVEVNEVFCRLFKSEAFIHGRLPHPDAVW